ncbi:MAG: APC family permease [Prolixibacteraceae bacterium]|nr:APC family permease [Prolixibacteraceae bacterium]
MTEAEESYPFIGKFKNIFIGKAKAIQDKSIFHKLSLVAFFAWIGLGADGITSSCYGPEEAFRNLQGHPMLAIFVALGTVFTIFIVSASYSQIIKLFPHGGGGYLVGSKLLSPTVGMISGCALIIDYVLTITISVSSGSDALFSFLPESAHVYKLGVAIGGVCLLILLNLRGVKESVLSLTPIFIVFMAAHLFIIIYAIAIKANDFQAVSLETSSQLHSSVSQLGIWGTLFIILKAYSMGAGTFTGIEAVSNGMPILREPKVKTAKKTMILMAGSLSFLVMGLMVAYALYNVQISSTKTLNAVLFENVTANWSPIWSRGFVLTTLLSEAALLFVAAQTGFIDGPRIMANMAIDKWFPKKFASLSDRLVTMNGVVLMGLASILLMALSRGSVQLLVVLYSINVFITFSISQLGMVRHWWIERSKLAHWRRKLSINGIGFILTTFILISVTVIKFGEGGWITLVITGLFILIAINIKRHYFKTTVRLSKVRQKALSEVHEALSHIPNIDHHDPPPVAFNPDAKTAIILVSGFGGTGLYTFLRINESFKGIYQNYIFIRIGVINSKIYRGSEELEHFKHNVKDDGKKYEKIANQFGFYGKSMWTIGTDPVSEVYQIVKKLIRLVPNSTFFGGQLVFSKTFFMSQLLHNHTIFSIQKRFFKFGIPIVIFPIKIE